MNNKLPTISVGIPAHNEEAAIKNLLTALVNQKGENFVLKEILVISDGSTDKTVENAKKVADKRIIIFDDKNRKGKSARLNEIFERFTGDILILCDADIIIENNHLFSMVINQANIEQAGVAVPKFLLVQPKTYIEKCLKLSVDLQLEIMKNWNHGTNYLCFRGAFLVLTRKLAKNLGMPDTLVNNDAYMYFKALAEGYQPKYIAEVAVYYKVPSSINDYRNQSSRYQDSYTELSKYLPINKHEYNIPKSLYLTCMAKYFLLHPVLFTSYVLLRYYVRVFKNKKLTAHWTMATSTKTV